MPAGLLEIVATVPPAVWGILSALSFGTADFFARFTTLKFGQNRSLLATLAVGWLVFAAPYFTSSPAGLSLPETALVVVHGVLLALALLFLYRCLARGPINLVAPIVAAHPVFIVVFAFATGSRPSVLQWALIVVIAVAVVVVTRYSQEAESGEMRDSAAERRTTIGLSLMTGLFYAGSVIAGQEATLRIGEVATLWLGHSVALACVLIALRGGLRFADIDLRWAGVLLLQGVLNALGVLFLLAGSHGAYPEITALLSSEFAVVTIVLAAVFLRERMTVAQFAGVLLIVLATGTLSLQ